MKKSWFPCLLIGLSVLLVILGGKFGAMTVKAQPVLSVASGSSYYPYQVTMYYKELTLTEGQTF